MKTMLPNFVVGITGKAGHGKDTVASKLEWALRRRGFLSTTYRLADPLKRAYEHLFSLPEEYLEDFTHKNEVNPFTNMTHRQELQFLGTEAYRTRTGNENVWVELLAHRIRKTELPNRVVLVPDVRFPNEAKFVQENGLLLEVVRSNSPLETASNHASEAGIGEYKPDTVLLNNGTLEDLDKTLEEFVRLTFIPKIVSLQDKLLVAKSGFLVMDRL